MRESHEAGSRPAPADQRRARDLARSTDRELIGAITAGEHQGLAELFRRHGPTVGAHARRICCGAQADDVVQDVFLRLWRQPTRFDPDRGSLPNFLRLQARRRAIDALRSERARNERETQHVRRGFDRGAAPDVFALDRHTVATALAALPDPERHAIVLAYFGGHTYRDVARILRQPEGTIKYRIRAGLSRLQAHLSSDGEATDRSDPSLTAWIGPPSPPAPQDAPRGALCTAPLGAYAVPS